MIPKKFTMTFTITFTIVLFITITVTQGCEICVPKENCLVFGLLNQTAQKAFQMKSPCSHTREKDPSKDFEPVATNKAEYICCSNAIWGTTDETKSNEAISTYTIKKRNADYENYLKKYNSPGQESYNAYPDSRTPSRYNLANNGPINYDRDDYQSNQDYYDRRMNDKRYNSNQGNPVYAMHKAQLLPRNRFNINNAPSNPAFPISRSGNNVNYVDRGGQCAITSSPPAPETGCCGREVSDSDRITGPSQEQITSSAPTNYDTNTWIPELVHWMSTVNEGLKRFERSVNDEKVEITIDNRIAGGRATELEQFPWTVLLYTFIDYGNRRGSFNCGGSLISSKYVLTAGHCVYEEGGTVFDLDVYLAEYDKRTFPTDCKTVLGQGQKCITNLIIKAEGFILHPQYENSQLQNDIALIRLRENAPYTNYIRPICLPSINMDKSQFFNLRLAVAGWGRNGRHESDIKQSTVLSLVPFNECKKFYSHITKTNLCAAGYSGEDTCKGDSGGPLMTVNAGKYEIVGIVSGKRADSPCGSSVPSLYTNVYYYLDWIHSTIRNNN